jgi:LmbE family N-acetylglucosaminyl deacetylase
MTASQHRRLLVLAPHPDDAALSVGGLLVRLREPVVLCTIFGRSNYTSRGFHAHWQTVSAIRKTEDAAFAASIGATLRYPALPEAAIRIGPSERLIFAKAGGRVADYPRLDAVLEATIASMRPRAVLAPAALGGHVDHILVRRVVSRILRTRDVPIAYYEDLPYAARIGAWRLVESILSFDARLKPLTVDITDQLTGKLRRLGLYKSQLGPAERSAVRRHSKRWGPGAVERLWSQWPVTAILDGVRLSSESRFSPITWSRWPKPRRR